LTNNNFVRSVIGTPEFERPKDDDRDATPNAPNAIVAVAAIAYFGVKYFLKEVDSSFVFLFSKVVDSMLFSLEVIIAFSDVWKVREWVLF
jgi:hypothetical protein